MADGKLDMYELLRDYIHKPVPDSVFRFGGRDTVVTHMEITPSPLADGETKVELTLRTVEPYRIPALDTHPADRVMIWSYEHDSWWGTSRCGYVQDARVAGVYSRGEAERICKDANIACLPGKPHEVIIELADVESHYELVLKRRRETRGG